MSRNQFEGAVVALALGDAHGAPFEGGPIERLLWRWIGHTSDGKKRWTDDTQMSLDVASSLIEKGHIAQDDIAYRFANGYRWSRGYGPGAAKILKRIRGGMPWNQANRSVYPGGSYGNGGAMRAPVIGVYYFDKPEMLEDACQQTAVLTHAHAQGIDGARLIAHATACAMRDDDPHQLMDEVMRLPLDDAYRQPLEQGRDWLRAAHRPSPAKVAKRLGNGISAAASTPSAVFIAVSFFSDPLDELIRFVCKGGGDTDTIAAMAGAIWGAANGYSALPTSLIAQLEQADTIRDIASQLFDRRQAG